MEIPVNVEIYSIRQDGEEQESFREKAAGTLTEEPWGWTLSYTEDASAGLGDVTTVLSIYDGTVLLKRSGAVRMEMELRPGLRTQCDYHMEFGSFQFGIQTSAIQSELLNCGGTVRFNYTMFNGGGEMSLHEIQVICKKQSA